MEFVTSPSRLRLYLDSLGAAAKKSLSQNFLIDGNIAEKMLAEAAICAGDSVLEIGPGPGALTERLLLAGAQVQAVEKDPLFAQGLGRLLRTASPQAFQQTLAQLKVDQGDILRFDLEQLPLSTKVVSNLPYHLTSPILGHLMKQRRQFSSWTLMVQEEVARRMTALANTKEYGALTVFVNFYTQVRFAFKVSRNCFYPRPKVDSAVVHLALKQQLPTADEEGFFRFMRSLFQQRRKMIRSRLPASLTEASRERLSQIVGAIRPEELTLLQWVRLYETVQGALVSEEKEALL